MDHPVDRFVDGPIAAQDENQIGTFRDGLARDARGIAGSGGGREARGDIRLCKRSGGTL
jgi:hypothetical protein